jgi:hypothetical protein
MVGAAVGVVVVATALDGWQGFLGSAVGSALVLAFFGVDVLVLRWTRAMPPLSVLAVVAMVWTLKITLLAVFLVTLRGTDAFGAVGFAIAVIVLTCVALGCALLLVTKRQVLLVDPTSDQP